MQRSLPACVDVREIVYRTQTLVESLQRVRFMHFDAVAYRKVVMASSAEASVEQRMQRALQLSIGTRNFGPSSTAQRDPAGTRFVEGRHRDYFAGLHSQVPRTKTVVYFVKVDARWPQGYGFFHLRVRVVPPARTPLGCPSAIPPLTESGLVLEGVLSAGSEAGSMVLEPFEPTMERAVRHAADHHARLRRTGAPH